MKQFLLTVAGVFVGLILFFIGVPILILVIAASSAKPAGTPSNAILALDLRGGLSDQDPSNPFASFSGPANSVMTVVSKLNHAQRDPNIKGLVLRLPETGIEPAAAEEIRQAVLRFRATKKPVYAHGQGLYASGVATATYMLGSAADEYWMQPGAPFEATGLASEDMFFKRAFDKYGVSPQFEQREQYKTAVNPYLFSDYTPAHLESQRAWMGSVYRQTLANAANDRNIKADVLQTAIEAGPYDAGQAASNGLIDRVGQVHEAEAALKKAAGADKVVKFEDYIDDGVAGSVSDASTIAVIRAEGAIMTGPSGGVSPLGGDSVSSDDIAKAFYDAIEDKDIKAIVFRVSSPGGSDTAAEQIGAALRAAKAAGKPVVVSMGTYAASGGYWISAEASRIIAQPTTLTGSIGVYGGKFAVGQAASRFGVDLRQTTVGGPYTGANNLGEAFTPAQRAAYVAQMDRVYARFVSQVAIGRKMTPERVRELAKGRVWTGVEAKELGLVDQLGGFTEAVEAAKRLAGITGAVRLKLLPPRTSLIDALQQALGMSAANTRAMAAAGVLLEEPHAKAMLEQAMEARLRSRGALTLAPRPFH